jgi:Tol biopolymer transport system component
LDGSNAPNSNSTSNIWMINADGSKPIPLTKLTAGGADSLMAAWSPDGSKIAFRSGRALDGSDALNTNFVNNIWVMNADGSNAIPLTKLTAANVIMGSAPAWSPDGSKIAFNSSRALDGSNANSNAINIWVINEDGSNPSPLTKLTAGSTSGHPIWSPDGSKIFFDSNRVLDGSDAINVQFRSNIWVVNADGTNPAPLTKLTAADCALPQQP